MSVRDEVAQTIADAADQYRALPEGRTPTTQDYTAADALLAAGYGLVHEAKAEALTHAANWLANGEAAGIIAYDGPSNRGEVMAAYEAALEDPERWLRERAEAALAVDPAGLHREERDGMAEAWREGRTAAPGTLNPYEEWPSTPDPFTAALNDQEGHSPVQTIHQRKAEAATCARSMPMNAAPRHGH